MISISQSEYNQRRRALMQQLNPNSIALFFAAPEIHLSADRECTYQPDPDFYYLSGFKEPNAVLAFIPNRTLGEFVMFTQTRDPSAEQWTGRRVGIEGAVTHYGADQAFPIETLHQHLPDLIANRETLYYAFGSKPAIDSQLLNIVQQLRRKVRAGISAPNKIINVEHLVHEMRLIKSEAEIAVMQHGADISANAHIQAMKACRPGVYEYQLRAELDYGFLKHGCKGPAYDSIVGGGNNACILHYTENSAVLNDGDLVLIDAGGEYESYASDITRTFPVNGRFSPEQKAIYELVLKAQLAAIAMIKPGLIWCELQAKIVDIFIEGLLELGILSGDHASLVTAEAHLPFYMHKSGHWLGLDTHDVGQYKLDAKWRPLQANMVLTVEPGLYISANMPNVDPKWYGIGVRIEDDVVVTTDGHHVLTHKVPKSIEEIEALINAS